MDLNKNHKKLYSIYKLKNIDLRKPRITSEGQGKPGKPLKTVKIHQKQKYTKLLKTLQQMWHFDERKQAQFKIHSKIKYFPFTNIVLNSV